MIRLNSRIFIIIFDFLFNNFFDPSCIVFQIINTNHEKKVNFVIHFFFLRIKLIKFFIDCFFIYRVKRINLLSEFERRRKVLIDIQINFYEIMS